MADSRSAPATLRLVGSSSPFMARLDPRAEEDGVELWTLRLTADAPAPAPRLLIEWSEAVTEAAVVWTPQAGRNKTLVGNDSLDELNSRATSQAPVFCVVSPKGESRLCVAASDALYPVRIKAGVREETGELQCRVWVFGDGRAPADRFEVTLRIDRRRVRYEDALASVSGWWEGLEGYRPSPVPDAALWPMYSTWCAFHQDLDAERIERQCHEAKALGCEAVIVDDGWQTRDARRGYGFCGDWEPVRIPDMRAHVAKVHALGMKYLLWYAVPYAGLNSRLYARFRDKLLYVHEHFFEPVPAGVLDPRYPEVREYLISTYETALREWNLDGFKLDFVNRFELREGSPRGAVDGRDYASVDEAVDRLLSEAMERLRRINPAVMVEFRQPYVGPLMRKYGNIFRVQDCPTDFGRNRLATIDLRLLSGATACHSDMLMWHPDEPVESAALQLLAVLFGVPQISVRLDRIPAAHREMLAFWLGFWREHRETLTRGSLRASAPELNYPQVTASDSRTSVAAAYARVVVRVDATIPGRELAVVNATRDDRLVLDLPQALGERELRVYDCRGREVFARRQGLSEGVHSFEVPAAGLLRVST